MSPYDFLELDVKTAGNLIKCIGKIESREMLNAIIVSNFPYLDKDKKQNVVRNLEKQSEVKTKQLARPVDNKELNDWLKGFLGG